MKINRVTTDELNFLQSISDIAYAPETLYYIGTLPNRPIKAVAIVGSRKPTKYGEEVTYKLAYELAQAGVVIISGLALGTDSIAHRATLDAGGVTIAVLASGLNDITPRSHSALAKQIVEKGGALISEYAPNKPAYASQFLARNRIISGLADMVIVTEAAYRSGSLSTAHHGLTQNKEIGAVPGPVTSALSTGTNNLIRQGAHPVTSAQDVLDIIAPGQKLDPRIPLGQTAAEQTIILLLQQGIRDGEILAEKSGLTPEQYLEAMTMLELAGAIRPLGGNQWILA